MNIFLQAVGDRQICFASSILADSLQIDGMALPFSQLDQPGPSVDTPPAATSSLRLRSEENEGKGRESVAACQLPLPLFLLGHLSI